MQVKIKKLHKDAILPTYATTGSGCFDLYSLTDCEVWGINSPTINTGLAFEIPDGYTMLVFSRSGHGFKNGVSLVNSVGVIDSDYKGEVKVKLVGDYLKVNKGDRVAQAMIIPYPKVEWLEVEELTETERGAGGFGSSGS